MPPEAEAVRSKTTRYQTPTARLRSARSQDWAPELCVPGQGLMWPTSDKPGLIADAIEKFPSRRIAPPKERDDTIENGYHNFVRAATYIEVMGGVAAGLAVLGLACFLGSLAVFAASVGYHLPLAFGISLVAAGVVVVFLAYCLARFTAYRAQRS